MITGDTTPRFSPITHRITGWLDIESREIFARIFGAAAVFGLSIAAIAFAATVCI